MRRAERVFGFGTDTFQSYDFGVLVPFHCLLSFFEIVLINSCPAYFTKLVIFINLFHSIVLSKEKNSVLLVVSQELGGNLV